MDKLDHRFGPHGKRATYLAEANMRKKRPNENYHCFGQALDVLCNKALPDSWDACSMMAMDYFTKNCGGKDMILYPLSGEQVSVEERTPGKSTSIGEGSSTQQTTPTVGVTVEPVSQGTGGFSAQTTVGEGVEETPKPGLPEVLVIREGNKEIEVIPLDDPVKQDFGKRYADARAMVASVTAASYIEIEGLRSETSLKEPSTSVINQVLPEGDLGSVEQTDPEGDPPYVETSVWYLEIGLNGEKMVWHIDPGACQTIVPTRLYWQMPPEERPQLINIGRKFLHAGGKIIPQMGRGVVTLSMGSLRIKHWVVFADVHVPLLGLDFQKLNNADTAGFSTHGFFGVGGELFQCWEGQKNNWCARVSASRTCMVPANSEMVIPT